MKESTEKESYSLYQFFNLVLESITIEFLIILHKGYLKLHFLDCILYHRFMLITNKQYSFDFYRLKHIFRTDNYSNISIKKDDFEAFYSNDIIDFMDLYYYNTRELNFVILI